MPQHAVADLLRLGGVFFDREEALLEEHKRRVAGLGNVFQKLPWLTARSPLGGFEMDFVLMHSIMRPRGTPSSLLLQRPGDTGTDTGEMHNNDIGAKDSDSCPRASLDSFAAAEGQGVEHSAEILEAKRRLLVRQQRVQLRLKRPRSARRISLDLSSEPGPGTSSSSSVAAATNARVLDPELNDDDLPVLPPATPCAPDAVVVTTDDALAADAEALEQFREPCERWACDEENLLRNRLADLTAQPTHGEALSHNEVIHRLAEEFGYGAIQRLRGPILQMLRESSAGPGTKHGLARRYSNVGLHEEQPQFLSPFAAAPSSHLTKHCGRGGSCDEQEYFIRHLLRMFVPSGAASPAEELSAAATTLANPILRGHISSVSHPLLHKELCLLPELSPSTLEVFARQQAMFLTYRNTVKYHRPQCLKDIAQELDDEATMRRITSSVFSEAVTTAADRLAALSDLVAESNQSVTSDIGGSLGDEGTAVSSSLGGSAKFKHTDNDICEFGDEQARLAAQRQAEVRVRAMIREWEDWLGKVAETQAAYNRLGRVAAPIVSPEEEEFLARDRHVPNHSQDNALPIASHPQHRRDKSSASDGDTGNDDDSGYESNEAVMGGFEEAEDAFFFPTDPAAVKRKIQRATQLEQEVLAFGQRHALACTIDFEMGPVQAECSMAARKGIHSFRRAAHLLLLVDRMWNAAEAIYSLAREARRAYKEAQPSVFLDTFSLKAEDMRAALNALVCDVVKQPSIHNLSVCVIAKRLDIIHQQCSAIDEVLGGNPESNFATPTKHGGCGDRGGGGTSSCIDSTSGTSATESSVSQGHDEGVGAAAAPAEMETLATVEELLAMAMPQLLILQAKVADHFHGLISSSLRINGSNGSGSTAASSTTHPRHSLQDDDASQSLGGTPEVHWASSSSRAFPSPVARRNLAGPHQSANLWQRARFAGVGEHHGEFSWVSHRIVIGPLLLYKDEQGKVVDDARSLVAACAAKNCNLALVVSVCKDYVLSGESFAVQPVSRSQIKAMGIDHVQIKSITRANLLNVFSRILDVIVNQHKACVYIHGKTGNTKAWVPALCFIVAQMGMNVPIEVAVDMIKDARPTIQLSKTYLSIVERMHPQLVDMFLQQS